MFAPQLVSQAAELLAKFKTYDSSYHPGSPAGSDHDGYCAAAEAHKGFMVPWKTSPVEDEPRHSAIHAGGRRAAAAEASGDPMESMSESQLGSFMAGGGSP